MKELHLRGCRLNTAYLPLNAQLQKLDLRANHFSTLPRQIPFSSLEILDLSENPLIRLVEEDTDRFERLQQLYLEDMPLLQSIDRNAFTKIRSTIKVINLQNSRQLQQINGYAFGTDIIANSSAALRSLNLRGSSITTLNSTLSSIFRQLDELDLKGSPLHCDCNLRWLRSDFTKETEGVCLRPNSLKGYKLSSLNADQLRCDSKWPHWLYGLTILSLMILCSFGLYFMVFRCRPRRDDIMRHRISQDSPYAPITTIHSND